MLHVEPMFPTGRGPAEAALVLAARAQPDADADADAVMYRDLRKRAAKSG